MLTFIAGATTTGAVVEIERGQKIVGNALRKFGQQVCRSGYNQERINGLRHRDVFDGRINIGLGIAVAGDSKHFGNYFFAGERREGKRAHKLLRSLGHHDCTRMPRS